MGVRDILDAAKRIPGSLVSRLRRKGSRAAPSESESSFGGEDGFDADSSSGDSFPGFATAPSFPERLKGALSYGIERIKTNPRYIVGALAGSAVVLAILLVFALAFRPPKPIAESSPLDGESLEVLRLIPVPRIDPLEEGSRLDRPPKARYTEAEVAEKWRDLGVLPRDALREKNWAELRALLSTRENP